MTSLYMTKKTGHVQRATWMNIRRVDKETEREYHPGPSKLKQFSLIEWPDIRMHILLFSLNDYLRKRMSPYTLPT